jgi:hypothetical protein
MKSIGGSILCCLFAALSLAVRADEIKTVDFGAASVVYDYQVSREGVATLSLNALVAEINDSLRGLKNSDPRRLGKLGQLIYQCKLLLYAADKNDNGDDEIAPMLISRNYSLFTGVGLSLADGERMGIKISTLQSVDTASLFTPELGGDEIHKELWQDVGAGPGFNLRQISVNVLMDSDVIRSAENMEIVVRFPIFQLQKSVRQWSYSFNLTDFHQAVRHANENCTPERFVELIPKDS